MSSASRTLAHWRAFSAAPHRMFFATGLTWLIAFSAWWGLVVAARAGGLAGFEPVVPGLFVHGAALLFLALSPFISGFLLTVFPRWMPAPAPGRTAQVTAFVLLNLGNALVLAGAQISPGVFTAGWLLSMAGLAVVYVTLASILARARQRVSHAWAVLIGLAAALTGMALFARGLLAGDYSAWPLVRGLGLWGFLLPVYFTVCHRMIPFFTSSVVPGYALWRPGWVLAAFVGLSLARALMELAPAWRWLPEAGLALVTAICAWQWRPRVATGVKLMTALHVAFAWLPLGLTLGAADHLASAAGLPGLLGRAPLHALGMGFFGSMLMAMVTRVTLGHSGRPLVFDELNWRLFLLVQVAAALRVAAELSPNASAWLTTAAAVAWLAGFGGWALRHAAIWFRPRSDGAPG